MSYGCVTTSTKASIVYFQVPWAHEKSELRAVCFILDSATYSYYVADAGDLTLYAEGDDDGSGARYSYACPFSTSVAAETGWGIYVWRQTTATEDAVSYDGSTIPIADIVAKFAELSDKGEEAGLEAFRAIRVPETDSNAFFPPKDIRADLVAGFDSDGNPTVGVNNIAELNELVENIEEAVSACNTYANAAKASSTAAETSATSAAASATAAAASATSAQTYATSAATSATSAKAYATSAAASASSADEDAQEVADALEEATELLTSAQSSAEKLYEAIKEAQAGASSTVESVDDLPTSSDDDAPSAGDIAYVKEENALYVYNGSTWEKVVDLDSLTGNVKTVSDLPSSGNTVGDVYFVTGEACYYQWNGEEWVAVLQATNTVIAYTPTATSLVAGVVKLSTSAVIDTTNGAGVVGFNDDEQLVVPVASDEELGVVGIGDGLSIDEDGYVSIKAATTEEVGGVLLSSDTILTEPQELNYDNDEDYEDQNYNFYGGRIGQTESGALLVRTAQLKRYGVVRLGSQFQPAYTAPYVVGLGASSNDETYGQLMFNLKQDGCLVYQAVSGSGVSGSSTVYEMSVLTAAESEDGCGVVYVTPQDEDNPTATVPSYKYVSNAITNINDRFAAMQAVIATLENASLFSLFHVSTTVGGTQYSVFYCTADAQTLTIYVSVVCQINETFFSKGKISVSTEDEDGDTSWFSVGSSFNDIYTYGTFTFTTTTNPYVSTRSVVVRISYFTQYAEFTVKQLGEGVAIDDVTISSEGGEIGLSEAD